MLTTATPVSGLTPPRATEPVPPAKPVRLDGTFPQSGPPRAVGALRLKAAARSGRVIPAELRSEGALKALFPRHRDRLETIMINASGGLTSGDRFDVEARALAGAHLTLTTQAAERAYRAAEGCARVRARISAEDGAVLHWLPQELIVFDGAALDRTLDVDLDPDARLLLAEPVILGRAAMGERVHAARLRDRITIRRGGAPVYLDALDVSGDLSGMMSRQALGAGAQAYAACIYIAPDAEAHLGPLRAGLPGTAGASLLARDILVLRMVAADGYALRKALVPVLDRLSADSLPTSWRL